MAPQLERMKTMLTDLTSIVSELDSLETSHQEKLKSRLLQFITFGLAPVGLADRLVTIVAGENPSALAQLCWWIVISAAIAGVLWVALRVMERYWPVDAELEKYSVTRDNREFPPKGAITRGR